MKKTLLTGVAALLLATGAASAQHDPHFYLPVTINGVETWMMVDTGATYVSLSFDDARRIGLNIDVLPKNGIADTANGKRPTSIFMLPKIIIDSAFVLHDIMVSCCVTEQSLLGMSALNKLGGVTFDNGWMTIKPPKNGKNQ